MNSLPCDERWLAKEKRRLFRGRCQDVLAGRTNALSLFR